MTAAEVVLVFVILLALRVPVAFAIIVPCLAYVVVDPSLDPGIALQRLASTLDSFPLLAVPLFITVGYIASHAGMAERLIDAIYAVVGRVKGSLAYVNVGSSLVFSWMSGSATADAAALGNILVPTMRRKGYDPGFVVGLTGAATMIGPIMPPSVSAILFAVFAGVSVGDMFIAGVVPALLIAVLLLVYVFIYTRKKDGLVGESLAFRNRMVRVVRAIPVLLVPVILLGGILGGVFTPTEAAGIAVVYMLVLAVSARWLSLSSLYQALAGSARTTIRVMIIAAAGGLLAYVFAREGLPGQVIDLLRGATDSPIVVLLLLNVLLLLLGMVLEPSAALLITVPVVMPVAVEFGIDPLQLGVVMILNLSVGLLTPPVGLVLYILQDVSGLRFGRVVRGVVPALFVLIVCLLILTYVPELSTFLPSLM